MPERGPIAVDIPARHAQVIGDAPRIAPVSHEELTDEQWALCIKVRESMGLREHSFLPEYLRTVVKAAQDVFAAHMELGTALFLGTIPGRERELAVLRSAWLCRAPFEWGAHVVISQRYGVTPEDVERATRGSSAEGWSEHERAVLRAVEEMIADQAIAEDTWNTLAKTWDEAQMIEFPMMVGSYVATAYVQNSLRTPMASGNPGLTRR